MLEWSEYSSDSGIPAIPLLLSERSQSLALAAIHFLQFAFRWGFPDSAAWDDIEGAIAECLNELMEQQMPDFTPVGTISAFFSDEANIPEKWLLCDGTVYPSADYPELAAIVPGGYSSGGSFTVPNIQERVLWGTPSPTGGVGALGGENDVTLTIAQIPAHNHIQRARAAGTVTVQVAAAVGAPNTANHFNTTTVTGDTGSGQSHNNIPANLTVNFIIKALP